MVRPGTVPSRLTRRSVVGAGLAGGASVAITACGAGGGGEAKPQTANVNASGTVRYFNWGNAFSDGIENKVIDSFHQKQSKIKVEFTNSTAGTGSHFDKLGALLAGGDPPDTALVDGYDIRALIKAGGARHIDQLCAGSIRAGHAGVEWERRTPKSSACKNVFGSSILRGRPYWGNPGATGCRALLARL